MDMQVRSPVKTEDRDTGGVRLGADVIVITDITVITDVIVTGIKTLAI